jgi:predicted ATPase
METATRFSQISLRNWKNFVHVDVPLTRRAFLVGPNASGKSNFLDALRFLHDVAADGKGFRSAVASRGGVSRIRSLAARKNPVVSVVVSIGSGQTGTLWTYELQFTQDNQRRPYVVKERVSSMGTPLLDRPNRQDANDRDRLFQTHLEQVSANRRFRDVAEFLTSVRYLHVVPQLIREPDRSIGRRDDPFGGDFLEQIARTPQRTRNARLTRILSALQVAVPQLRQIELIHDNVTGAPHLRGRYEHWRPQGAWHSEEQLSDGTLRLIGLFWSMLSGPGPLLLEEPELSLHSEIIRRLPQLMHRVQQQSGRQIILSTHSQDILLDDGIGLDEVLLVRPGEEGSTVGPASAMEAIKTLVQAGVSVAEATLPHTRPKDVVQLAMSV